MKTYLLNICDLLKLKDTAEVAEKFFHDQIMDGVDLDQAGRLTYMMEQKANMLMINGILYPKPQDLQKFILRTTEIIRTIYRADKNGQAHIRVVIPHLDMQLDDILQLHFREILCKNITIENSLHCTFKLNYRHVIERIGDVENPLANMNDIIHIIHEFDMTDDEFLAEQIVNRSIEDVIYDLHNWIPELLCSEYSPTSISAGLSNTKTGKLIIDALYATYVNCGMLGRKLPEFIYYCGTTPEALGESARPYSIPNLILVPVSTIIKDFRTTSMIYPYDQTAGTTANFITQQLDSSKPIEENMLYTIDPIDDSMIKIQGFDSGTTYHYINLPSLFSRSTDETAEDIKNVRESYQILNDYAGEKSDETRKFLISTLNGDTCFDIDDVIHNDMMCARMIAIDNCDTNLVHPVTLVAKTTDMSSIARLRNAVIRLYNMGAKAIRFIVLTEE